MKKHFTFFFLLMLSTISFGQTPHLINYQAVVRNNSGQPLANQAVGVKISLLHNAANGAEVYSETHSETTNQFGLINIQIGEGNPTLFSSIDWSDGIYFVQLGIDASGSTNYQTMGTTQLLSVPYAIYAEEAEKMDRWYPNPSGTMFSPEDNPKKGISFGRNSNNQEIYTIAAYDTNPSTTGPQKLMIYGKHLYLNDNSGWKLYNVGVGVPPNEEPKEKLHVKGKIYVDDLGGIIMRSPNGGCWEVQVSNSGTMTTTQVSCP